MSEDLGTSLRREPIPDVRRLGIIGGGPIGVEAALYGARLGYQVSLYEAISIGAHMLSWGHAQMFTPWWMNVSSLGVMALESAGWQPPDAERLPTGKEFVYQYLRPLANVAARDGVRIRLGARVLAMGRDSHLKGEAIGGATRSQAPFRLLINHNGVERVSYVERLIDATGVYGHPNWLGAGGIPAPGERAATERIAYHLEDYTGAARKRYAGARVLVVGSGHSAATAVCELAKLAGQERGTTIYWVARRRHDPVIRYKDDPLPLRDRLARAANHLAGSVQPSVNFVAGHAVAEIREVDDGLEVGLQAVASADLPGRGNDHAVALRAGKPLEVDRIIALVGYRPDLDIGRELQLHTCWATEGPMKLAAALLGETSTDCLDQSSPGPESLGMPEPGCVWLGHKAYGRNPAFLIRLGHEQIRDAFRLFEGDPELDLYAEPRPATATT